MRENGCADGEEAVALIPSNKLQFCEFYAIYCRFLSIGAMYDEVDQSAKKRSTRISGLLNGRLSKI
jgi:hypothetical protein